LYIDGPSTGWRYEKGLIETLRYVWLHLDLVVSPTGQLSLSLVAVTNRSNGSKCFNESFFTSSPHVMVVRPNARPSTSKSDEAIQRRFPGSSARRK
jgi:hypothetical protein